MSKLIEEKEHRRELEAAAEKAKQWLLSSSEAPQELRAALRVSKERAVVLASTRVVSESEMHRPVTL